MSNRLSAKFERALVFAFESHHGQMRKGSPTPYISHPLAVAALVMEHGGTEDQAIAALLHDVLEDCGVAESELEERFGADVARLVADCSDWQGPAGAKKPPWRERKEAYIAHIPDAKRESLLVAASDKLHNARTIVHDARHYGDQIWKRFSAEPPAIAWYYREALAALRKRLTASAAERALIDELSKAVRELETALPKKKKTRPK
jgi:(p)ppGpp synthase/HD superfamily hydrolase